MTYQCPHELARHLYDDWEAMRAALAVAQSQVAMYEAAHALEQALRARAENKLKPPAPRRDNRDREEY